jgi:NADH-quinone oxidoreductase subunit A
MDPAWAAAASFAAVAVAVPLGTLLAARILRVRPREIPITQEETYECGEEAEGLAQVRFHPRYYVVALIFVIFDVEAAFLLPWALNLREPGLVALVEMFLFMGILLLGWLYAARKGAFTWQ